MATDLGIVKIPDRFESLRKVVGIDRISHVLIEPPDDIVAMKQIVAELKSSVQGKLVFLHGETGSGKTCLAESLPIFLPNLITNVLTSPPDYELPLDQLVSWIARSISDPQVLAKGGNSCCKLRPSRNSSYQ